MDKKNDDFQDDSLELEKRKKKIAEFFKQKKDWIYYLILLFIVSLSVYIRTRNIPRLKDITTGTWTLGPDLDPFLFLRWTEYIVEHGKLMINDTMRYVPIGYDTSGEMKLLAYMIDWFYHTLSLFYKETTVTYAAILFPVFMAALTAIAFFLFARKVFYKENNLTKNIIALISTLFFVLIPSLLPRTIAGIPEKESAAFFFMFMAFYFFLEAFSSEKFRNKIIFGALSGIATALMALIWGGVLFVFLTIPSAIFISLLLGKIDRDKFIAYAVWTITSITVIFPFSTRYTLKNLVTSISTGLAIGVLILVGVYLLISKSEKIDNIRKKSKLPKELFLVIIPILILIIIILFTLGPDFIINQINEIKSSLITPTSTRFGLTVAENKQPYFSDDWKGSFGPVKFNIPLYFWLFFVGCVVLFSSLISKLGKKDRWILTLSYFVFLICLIFSRYSPSSTLNGVSGLSQIVYFSGWILFLGMFFYTYHNYLKKGEGSLFKEFNFEYILYFIVLTIGIIGARGGIRLIMVLGAISPVAISFLIVKSVQKYNQEKDETFKFFIGFIVLIIILSSIFTLWAYYKESKAAAESFAPGPYQWQWQKAMAWIRDNTSENAVFGHWWDYGYWIQSIGERATILDGGNAIVYWNHLLGRHVLTGDDETKALEFLYAHNGTHLLIDSTDIGKYTAFSSIGSDESYDKFSWISTFLMDERQTQETKNETRYIYTGGFINDEDINWAENGTNIFLPKRKAGIGAVILGVDKERKILQPEVIFIYNGKQYIIPLRYIYTDKKMYDFKSGLDAGVFVFPRLDSLADGRVGVKENGALLYLSKRTVHSQLANLYLFDRESKYFKLVHTEDNLVIENLKQQRPDIGNFVYYQGVQGPIKIWEVKYPSNIILNQEYLKTDYPKNLSEAKTGEY